MSKRDRNSRHHRKPKKLGGKSEPENISIVPHKLHQAWHTMFGCMKPNEIIDQINRIWIDPNFKLLLSPVKPPPEY